MNIQLGVKPMTVVLAMRDTNDSIIIGSDREATDENGQKSQRRKIHQVQTLPLMWGCAGNPAIGVDQFGEWLQKYDFVGKTWAQFMPDAGMALSELNGAQRARTKASGWKEEEIFFADCLVVGWLDKPNICLLSSDGRVAQEWEIGFRGIGTGAAVATPIYNAMLELGGYDAEKMVKTMLIIAQRTAPNCGPPVEAWRLTKTGSKQLFHLTPKLVPVVGES